MRDDDDRDESAGWCTAIHTQEANAPACECFEQAERRQQSLRSVSFKLALAMTSYSCTTGEAMR